MGLAATVRAVAVADAPIPMSSMLTDPQTALTHEWRRLTRVATFVAFLTSPSVFYWYYHHNHWGFWWSLVGAFFTVVAFRGLVDVVVRKLIPWPSLFGMDDVKVKENDVVNRRRAWTWRWFYRLVVRFIVILTFVYLFRLIVSSSNVTYFGWVVHLGRAGAKGIHNPQVIFEGFYFLILMCMNFVLFLGPLLAMGISQIRGYEPGDAEWGVKLDDIRGQAQAKEEVRRVVTLWQSGEVFEQAGGKRERGLLFLGAPGTGKTMLAKGIATSFNSPFVTIPGSGFAQTFIGVDAIIVRFLARKAKKLARKWGGQCIVFIDEIDAVGMRRQSLGANFEPAADRYMPEFYGRYGAINQSGDLICESREWRDWLFEQRAPERRSPYPGWYSKSANFVNNIVNQGIFPGMGGMGGGMALNQLLITMDGIDNPPFLRRVFTNKINSFLDAIYIVPRHAGSRSLRIPKARATGAQIYFIGATNVPIERLDPALIRPGRMGRHVTFRTPTKEDRIDVFDLYLSKVAHDPELDTPNKRDEIARITNGYSPAMIDQICSMALTKAHHEGRAVFGWQDLVESMTVVESGTEIGFEYTPGEARQVAIHEAGHAVAAHIYRTNVESSRLSIKRRGQSGGHHQSFEKEDRFVHFQSELFADMIHGLGAMAAEIVFYGENSEGVGGDLGSVTREATRMVGGAGMAPQILDLRGAKFADETEEETQARIRKRFEDIGLRLMNRFNSSETLGDGRKRGYAAQFIGEAFVTAYNAMVVNKEAVSRIADAVIEKQEIFGDDLIKLLDSQHLIKPEIAWTDEASWPKVVWTSKYDNPWDRDRGREDREDRPGPRE
jgi:cell division protease FtsH